MKIRCLVSSILILLCNSVFALPVSQGTFSVHLSGGSTSTPNIPPVPPPKPPPLPPPVPPPLPAGVVDTIVVRLTDQEVTGQTPDPPTQIPTPATPTIELEIEIEALSLNGVTIFELGSQTIDLGCWSCGFNHKLVDWTFELAPDSTFDTEWQLNFIVPLSQYDLSGTWSGTWEVEYNYMPTSVVPLPAAFWLFATGLTGLIGIGKGFRQSKSS